MTDSAPRTLKPLTPIHPPPDPAHNALPTAFRKFPRAFASDKLLGRHFYGFVKARRTHFSHEKPIRCINTGMDNTQYFSLADVAKLLRCRPFQIVYLLTTGQVPEPALRNDMERIFTIADIQRIKERLDMQLALGPVRGIGAR
jgi:hypothetical protein